MKATLVHIRIRSIDLAKRLGALRTPPANDPPLFIVDASGSKPLYWVIDPGAFISS